MLADSSKLKPSCCMAGAFFSMMPVRASKLMPVFCETENR